MTQAGATIERCVGIAHAHGQPLLGLQAGGQCHFGGDSVKALQYGGCGMVWLQYLSMQYSCGCRTAG